MRNQTPETDNMRASTKFFLSKKQSVFFQRKRVCPLAGEDENTIDYKNLRLLEQFISHGGRILPMRITAVSAKKQRMLKQAIKRARNLALLPFAGERNK